VLRAQAESEWGAPVIDIHHHWRPEPDANLRHVNGAGIARAVLLTPAAQDAGASAMSTARFVRFTSVNAAAADAVEQLRKSAAGGRDQEIEDLLPLYERIQRDLGTGYQISYKSQRPPDGQLRRVEVQVRNSDLQVYQSTNSYYPR
jgi:hypothetical protein